MNAGETLSNNHTQIHAAETRRTQLPDRRIDPAPGQPKREPGTEALARGPLGEERAHKTLREERRILHRSKLSTPMNFALTRRTVIKFQQRPTKFNAREAMWLRQHSGIGDSV
jgi:hypothetical protein